MLGVLDLDVVRDLVQTVQAIVAVAVSHRLPKRRGALSGIYGHAMDLGAAQGAAVAVEHAPLEGRPGLQPDLDGRRVRVLRDPEADRLAAESGCLGRHAGLARILVGQAEAAVLVRPHAGFRTAEGAQADKLLAHLARNPDLRPDHRLAVGIEDPPRHHAACLEHDPHRRLARSRNAGQARRGIALGIGGDLEALARGEVRRAEAAVGAGLDRGRSLVGEEKERGPGAMRGTDVNGHVRYRAAALIHHDAFEDRAGPQPDFAGVDLGGARRDLDPVERGWREALAADRQVVAPGVAAGETEAPLGVREGLVVLREGNSFEETRPSIVGLEQPHLGFGYGETFLVDQLAGEGGAAAQHHAERWRLLAARGCFDTLARERESLLLRGKEIGLSGGEPGDPEASIRPAPRLGLVPVQGAVLEREGREHGAGQGPALAVDHLPGEERGARHQQGHGSGTRHVLGEQGGGEIAGSRRRDRFPFRKGDLEAAVGAGPDRLAHPNPDEGLGQRLAAGGVEDLPPHRLRRCQPNLQNLQGFLRLAGRLGANGSPATVRRLQAQLEVPRGKNETQASFRVRQGERQLPARPDQATRDGLAVLSASNEGQAVLIGEADLHRLRIANGLVMKTPVGVEHGQGDLLAGMPRQGEGAILSSRPVSLAGPPPGAHRRHRGDGQADTRSGPAVGSDCPHLERSRPRQLDGRNLRFLDQGRERVLLVEIPLRPGDEPEEACLGSKDLEAAVGARPDRGDRRLGLALELAHSGLVAAALPVELDPRIRRGRDDSSGDPQGFRQDRESEARQQQETRKASAHDQSP